MSADVVLDVRDLAMTFRPPTGPVDAVRGVSFQLNRGKVLGIVGESGSGKSATFRALLGLSPPTASISGEVRFNGEEIAAGAKPLRNASAMIYQNPGAALNPVFTIGQQLQWVARSDTTDLVGLLEQVGLPNPERALDAYPHEFSGGMRQRAVIAMALAKKPTLLVADEPTTALDVTTQDRILGLLDELRERHDLTVAFISHDLEVVRRIADNIAVMQHGRIVEAGRAEQVFTEPQHDYTKALLAATPTETAAPFTPDDSPPILAIEDLAVEYRSRERQGTKVRVIDGLNVTIEAGETLALVGESGSGKSTLAHAIVGLNRVAGGSIRYAGTELVGLRGRARRTIQQEVQIVFQNPLLSLNPRHRVGSQLEEPMNVHLPLGARERRERIEKAASDMDLDVGLLDRFPHELSGGQAQRMVLARALLLEPKLIVFDEPTSALDVSVQASVLDLLAQLKTDRKLTYLFITHDLAVARQIAERIAVMKQGEIVELAPTEDLFADPQHDYTRELLMAAQLEEASC